MASRVNLDKLHDELKTRLPEFISVVLPNAKKQAKGYRIGDVQGNKGESLWIGDEGFKDHATGGHGSLIRLASEVWNTTIPEAARQLSAKLAINAEEDVVHTEVPAHRKLVPLTDDHKAIIQGRNLDPELAVQLGLQSTTDGAIAFPLIDSEGRQVGIKYRSGSQWSAERGSANVLWPLQHVQEAFPDSDTIFITEGHWDAIAAIQAGFPAVSIPNGASNTQWIDTCFNFIHSFSTVVLCYDNDTPGIIGLKLATGRLSKGVKIITYPEDCKDTNDILTKHGIDRLKEVLADARNFEPENVISSYRLWAEAKEADVFEFEHESIFGQDFAFKYRPHEYTVITAYTGHGKSNIIRQSILNFAILDDTRSFIASFEDTPKGITRELIRHMGKEMPEEEVKRILRNIDLYDTTQLTKRKKKAKVSPTELLDLFEIQYKRYGTRHFVVDNMMTLAIDRSDLSAQSEAADLFRQFVISFPVHLHLVAHPRKQPAQLKSLEPPDPHDIRGASEIADLSWNIIGHVRNIKKEREIAAMRMRREPEDAIKLYWTNHPDAVVHINKQRTTGQLPTAWLWFDPVTKTYRTSP